MRHQVAGGGGGVAMQDGIDGVVAGVTLQLLQFKIHFGMGSAMENWNCYNVTVTQGVSNPNDRLGVNGTVAIVAVARVSDCKSYTTNHDRNSLRDGEC